MVFVSICTPPSHKMSPTKIKFRQNELAICQRDADVRQRNDNDAHIHKSELSKGSLHAFDRGV